MTFSDLVSVLSMVRGNPRIVIYQENFAVTGRICVQINVHRHCVSRIAKLRWSDMRPLGSLFLLKTRSHEWLKKNSHDQAQFSLTMVDDTTTGYELDPPRKRRVQ